MLTEKKAVAAATAKKIDSKRAFRGVNLLFAAIFEECWKEIELYKLIRSYQNSQLRRRPGTPISAPCTLTWLTSLDMLWAKCLTPLTLWSAQWLLSKLVFTLHQGVQSLGYNTQEMGKRVKVNMVFPYLNLTFFDGREGMNFPTPQTNLLEELPPITNKEVDVKVLKMSIIFYSVIFILGIPGNGLVIWIAGFKMKNVTAVWFLNLAIADFICCLILPLKIADWALYLKGEVAYTLCKVSTGIMYITMCASVNFLVAMSIDRCASIMWPIWSKNHKTPKCVRSISVIIWGLSLTLSLPHVIFNRVYFDISECMGKLDFHIYTSDMNKMKITRLVTMFVIPFVIILVCYCLIFFKLIQVKKSKKSQRPYRIITAVVTCFFICWFPYYTWPLIPVHIKSSDIDNTVYAMSVCLAYFNSCINPILYVFIGRDFKESLMRSIPSRLESAIFETSHPSAKERESFI
ncbi:C3a anaphylatoxin chemotactic receptor-like [Pseudophryne corroboree]|uniref:C3a anaphylatoxin chemotactic receptor-like n=1 Tax=Pseudophryne corroboree TaxID=495146 RepID=UPI003081F81B